MNAKIIFPYGFDPNESVKYPVLMQTYGGPTSQMVQQTYKVDFMTSMAASGFIVMFVDGRGSGFRGRVCYFWMNKRLTQCRIIAR